MFSSLLSTLCIWNSSTSCSRPFQAFDKVYYFVAQSATHSSIFFTLNAAVTGNIGSSATIATPDSQPHRPDLLRHHIVITAPNPPTIPSTALVFQPIPSSQPLLHLMMPQPYHLHLQVLPSVEFPPLRGVMNQGGVWQYQREEQDECTQKRFCVMQGKYSSSCARRQ